jgi:hypothetical protein
VTTIPIKINTRKRKIRKLLCGLPKVHKPDFLRGIVSCRDSPCYALAEFLHKILSSPAINTGSFVKNSEHFIKLIQDINLQN